VNDAGPDVSVSDLSRFEKPHVHIQNIGVFESPDVRVDEFTVFSTDEAPRKGQVREWGESLIGRLFLSSPLPLWSLKPRRFPPSP